MNLTGRPIYQKGQKPERSTAFREGARGRQCELRIPGICRGDPAYTVGCHMRFFGFGGAAQKPDDLFMIDACDRCHAVLDSRDKWADTPLDWDDVLAAFMRTLHARRAAGLITIGDRK